MADRQPAPSLAATVRAIRGARPNVTEQVHNIRAQTRHVQAPVIIEGELADFQYDPDSILALLITAANGDRGLTEQRVTVEYLRNDQRLVIPYALGMNPLDAAPTTVQANTTLCDRYFKASAMTFVEVENLVETSETLQVIRENVDARPNVTNRVLNTTWAGNAFYFRAGAVRVPPDEASMIFAIFSQALQFNCDIRDTHKLNLPNMRLSDSAWREDGAYTANRLNVKLMPYTLQSIAALNLPACADQAMAAWTRAFGLSSGILPDVASRSRIEYKFSLSQPTAVARTAVRTYEAEFPKDLFAVALNLIAMFGFFHLNKDHTFKSNDPNMERICVSYLKTLRTIVTGELMDNMVGHLEVLCRTTAHPFGLSQTYFVGKYMMRHGALAAALAQRIDVTPPPIQRVMIVCATELEWSGVPAGKTLSAMHMDEVYTLQQERQRIMACPPAYSALHHLYGIEVQMGITDATKAALEALMPVVYGYSISQHVDEQNHKDGLAHALSLLNVARDRRAVVNMYLSLWNKYMDNVDQSGLVQFAEESLRSRTNLAAQGFGPQVPQ